MSTISPVEQRAEPRKQFRPTRRQQVAIMLFTVTGPLLALNHWQYGGRISFFGPVPITKVFVVACIGGAATFTLYADRAQRWIAPVAGALAGFGAFGIHLVYTTLFERESMWNIE